MLHGVHGGSRDILHDKFYILVTQSFYKILYLNNSTSVVKLTTKNTI